MFANQVESGKLVYVLAPFTIAVSLVFAAAQERVFRVPGFTYSGWMTFLSLVTCTCLGFAELLVQQVVRRGRHLDYMAVALFVFGGNACTNASLNYLSYPLRVMFKSSKLLPVMLMSQFYLRRRYSAAQYANCIVLISAIVLFSWGDSSSDGASLQVRGLILILLGIFFDALTVSEPQLFSSTIAPLISVVMFLLRDPRRVKSNGKAYEFATIACFLYF